jgi:hypothetical protein
MYLRRATRLLSEQPPSGVTAEGGANVYGAFGRVCSIFLVLLFRGFDSNELLKVAFTGTFPLVANSFSVSYGKSTKASAIACHNFRLEFAFLHCFTSFLTPQPSSPFLEGWAPAMAPGYSTIFVHKTDTSVGA